MYDEKSLAMARAVANLANSAGWRLIGPKTSHDREPLMSGATNIVTSSNSSIAKYIG